MSDTEQEQIEDLKKWWAENGRAIIVGVVIGAGAIFGWRFWQANELEQAETASTAYQVIVSEFNNGNQEAVIERTAALQQDFASTPYASMASLLRAKLAVDSKDLKQAIESLRWAMEHTPEQDMRSIATLRLARVMSADEQHDEALAILNTDFADAFSALVEELRGDILVAQGNLSLARSAYQKALTAESQSGTSSLQMKLDDLAVAEVEPQS